MVSISIATIECLIRLLRLVNELTVLSDSNKEKLGEELRREFQTVENIIFSNEKCVERVQRDGLWSSAYQLDACA